VKASSYKPQASSWVNCDRRFFFWVRFYKAAGYMLQASSWVNHDSRFFFWGKFSKAASYKPLLKQNRTKNLFTKQYQRL